jgi:sulfide:quinone oxidoreductase
MVGLRKATSIKRPLSRLARRGIEVVHGEIESIDPEGRVVTVGGQRIAADYIVVSLGADLAPETVPGLIEAGHNFYTLPGAAAFHDALRSLRSGRIVVLTAAPAYKCPAAPYEVAMLVDDFCRKAGMRASVSVDVYAAEPGPMGVAGPVLSSAVKEMLQSKGIRYHPEHQVRSVDPAGRRLDFVNGVSAGFDLLAYVPPHRAPRVVLDCGLASESGWVSVDRHTLETRFTGVYAIGDVVSIPLQLGKPLPKAGVFAHLEAEVVAKNVAAAVLGRTGGERFEGHGECFVEIGGGKAAFGTGNFYAEPVPVVALRLPSRWLHFGKVLVETAWLNLKL